MTTPDLQVLIAGAVNVSRYQSVAIPDAHSHGYRMRIVEQGDRVQRSCPVDSRCRLHTWRGL